MDATEEDLLVAQVVDRLSEHFPDTSRLRIAEVVDDEHHRLDGNPIRDFIPVLVEHAARVRLRDEGEATTPITPPESGASHRLGLKAGDVSIETIFNARVTQLGGGLGGGTS